MQGPVCTSAPCQGSMQGCQLRGCASLPSPRHRRYSIRRADIILSPNGVASRDLTGQTSGNSAPIHSPRPIDTSSLSEETLSYVSTTEASTSEEASSSSGCSSTTTAEAHGRLLFDDDGHLPPGAWSPSLLLYAPLGLVVAAMRMVLWLGGVLIDAPWFRYGWRQRGEGEGFGRPLNTFPGSLLQAAGGGGGLPGHARIPLHVAGAGTAAAGATRHGLEPRDCRGSDGTVPGGSSGENRL